MKIQVWISCMHSAQDEIQSYMKLRKILIYMYIYIYIYHSRILRQMREQSYTIRNENEDTGTKCHSRILCKIEGQARRSATNQYHSRILRKAMDQSYIVVQNNWRNFENEYNSWILSKKEFNDILYMQN